MARRIRWQLLIATLSSLLVIALMGGLALSKTAVTRATRGGGYIEGVVGVPQQINPLLNESTSDPVGADLGALLFEGLTRIGPGGLPEPALAERWAISDDGLVYTVTLRAGLRWHDGAPLDASDVVFSYRAIKHSSFPGPPALRAFWQDVLVDPIDERQVQFQLAAPYSPFLNALGTPVVPEHVLGAVPVEQWARAPFSTRPVGNGLYRLTQLDGQRALLEANQSYHGQPPLIDRVELRFFGAADDALQALDTGEIDGTGYLATRMLGAQSAQPAETQPFNLPLDDYTVLTFNLRRAPLDQLELRRALAQGLDKQQLLAQALDGRAQVLDTPILPSWYWAFSPEATWYATDAARADQILTELGYVPTADGVRARAGQELRLSLITDSTPDRIAAAREIASQWLRLGIAVELSELDAGELQQRLAAHDFELALHGWTGLGPDPDVLELWHSSQAEGGANYAGLEDEQIDALLSSARAERDLGLRARDYASFQRRWIELAPSIVLYQPLYVYVVRERVGLPDLSQGEVEPALFGRADRFRTIGRWFVNSAREIRGDLREQR
jgi:peptide/nickel transport system substrate-binding protein